jgi:hypothetical protein
VCSTCRIRVRTIAEHGDIALTSLDGTAQAAAAIGKHAAAILTRQVISLRQMSGRHAVACLARLAEVASPALTLPDWCAAVPAAPPTTAVDLALVPVERPLPARGTYVA